MKKEDIIEKFQDSFSIRELADLCGVSTGTIKTWIADGKIEAWKIGRQYRISASGIHLIQSEEERKEEHRLTNAEQAEKRLKEFFGL